MTHNPLELLLSHVLGNSPHEDFPVLRLVCLVFRNRREVWTCPAIRAGGWPSTGADGAQWAIVVSMGHITRGVVPVRSVKSCLSTKYLLHLSLLLRRH
eukprot:CAMPEP_0181525712 /NCGR_PEP_ID=MMETSP1110-20121109/69108_1 /TAXON_ID=174948 /ORGANISM="Symbiodinium sp., Strain CCMP421" /LENGTH=97 /DNA_ID=CAMNT_0023656523 /DNA_START=235 /DNA_END=525 /DNA_ORIENTATION=+